MVSFLFTRRAKELATVLAASTLACGGETASGIPSGFHASAPESSGSSSVQSSSSGGSSPTGPAPVGSASGGVGACLLSYNTAPLTLSDGSPSIPGGCCLFAGDRNHCDTGAICGAAAVSGCCLIYAAPAAGFSGCCQYEHDIQPATGSRCADLLKMGR
jgi:hypothetical protein